MIQDDSDEVDAHSSNYTVLSVVDRRLRSGLVRLLVVFIVGNACKTPLDIGRGKALHRNFDQPEHVGGSKQGKKDDIKFAWPCFLPGLYIISLWN